MKQDIGEVDAADKPPERFKVRKPVRLRMIVTNETAKANAIKPMV